MKKSLDKILQGYQKFREKYAHGESSVMEKLADHGQTPQIMVVACCDSRVDPALILQCDPGDLFIVRNVANIVPPFENDEAHHGTSAALEFGIKFLKIKHLIILGHSQCGGIQARFDRSNEVKNDFISSWVSLIDNTRPLKTADDYAKFSLNQSLQNSLTFPWIKSAIDTNQLGIHLWFFDIKTGKISTFNESKQAYIPIS